MQYNIADVSQLLGLSREQIRRLVREGFIRPARGERNALRFSFQDLIVLRTAAALLKARVPATRILRNLRGLRAQLPKGRSLTEVRITTDGTHVVVHDGRTSWLPESGQVLIDFNVAELAAKAEPIARMRSAAMLREAADHSAREWFDVALELETVAPSEAREAYARVLAADPKHADAHVNLGRLLHEDGHATEAATHYLQALRCEPEHVVAAFNLGVAMEDLGRLSEAMKSYQQCISADPTFADAYFNLANVLEKIGDKRGAIRNLTKYRRLTGTTS